VLIASSPTEQDRVGRLGSSIMCPVCQGESIASSPSQMARDMMALVTERVEQGATDAEIIDELLSSYTGALLLDPPVSGPTIVLWVAPALALLAGIGVIIWWKRQPEPPEDAPDATPRTRRAIGAVGLIGAIAAIVTIVGFFLQDRDDGPMSFIGQIENLDDVSNETMEAVIATNLNDPAINGMRLALADRYLGDFDYRAAFPHFFAVAGSETASSAEAVRALVGLGWMAWDGNREAEAALGLFDQALAIDPNSVNANYLKGLVLWCGSDDTAEAASLLAGLLQMSDLPGDTRTIVERDLAAIRSGEGCL